MKRIMLVAAMLMGMLGVAHARVQRSTTSTSTGIEVGTIDVSGSDAQCKYTLADARSGLRGLVPSGFVPRQQSQDGNRVLGLMFFHNPASADPESADAVALVMRDKRIPDKELTLVVFYPGPKQTVIYKREIKPDGKTLGACFERVVAENTQKSKYDKYLRGFLLPPSIHIYL